MGIQNKTAVIMGGAGAIGKAIAQRYAKEGAKIVIVDLNGEKAKAVAEEIKNQGGSASWICADVAEEPQVEKLTKEILEEYKTIDILVNSVGKFKTMPMMDITVEYWDDMMRNNLRNTFICTMIIGEVMTKQKEGTIINIGSTAAERGRVGQVAYCAAKGGIETFTMSAAIQLSPFGVNVNSIAPGVIEEGEGREILFTEQELDEYTKNRMPITRWGTPEDVAGVALFLASEDSSYITGQTITVDGGLSARLVTCGEDR